MCGIFGFWGKGDRTLLERMGTSIFHRGPDEAGFYLDDYCGLGIRRLSIVDVVSGQQPCFSVDNSVLSVFNGEIYNFKELRAQMESKGYKFRSDHSDSELIPNLYLEYGINFVSKLRGMFAIALYDRKNKRAFLLRDRVGKKPLYYAIRNSVLYFGSEIKVIKEAISDLSINMDSVFDYFQKKNTVAPNTIYEGVCMLEPASWLEYSGALELSIYRYWNFEFRESLKLKTEEEYAECLIDKIEDSVRIRSYTDVEFGSYLSGGLDSTLITAILKNKLGIDRLKTFTLVYDDESLLGKYDDAYFARMMSEKLNTRNHTYCLSSDEVFDSLPSVIKSFDEPFAGTVSTFFLTGLIRQNVKVAFSGDGADELFGSYFTHRLSNPVEYLKNRHGKAPDYSSLTEIDRKAIVPFDSAEEYLKLKKAMCSRDWRRNLSVFNDNELRRLFRNQATPAVHNSLKGIDCDSKSELNITLEAEFKDNLHNQVLAFVDRLSMAHSVEVRSPFLDNELIDLVARFPHTLKIKDGVCKYILKKAALKYLPEELVFRKKEGFVMPNYHWIEGKFFDRTREIVTFSGIVDHYGLDRLYIDSLFDELKTEKMHHAKIWSLLNFAIWHKNR